MALEKVSYWMWVKFDPSILSLLKWKHIQMNYPLLSYINDNWNDIIKIIDLLNIKLKVNVNEITFKTGKVIEVLKNTLKHTSLIRN